MKKQILFFVLFILLISSIALGNGVYFFNFDTGMKVLTIEQKTGMVVFDSEHCVYCKKLKEVTFADKEVMNILNNHYITIELSLDKNETIHYQNQEIGSLAFAATFKIRGTPTMVFFDEKDRPITLLPGYLPPDKMIPILKFVGQRLYKQNLKFGDYLKNPQEGKFVGSSSLIKISLEDVKFLVKNDPFVKVYSFIDFKNEIKDINFIGLDEFKKSINGLSKNVKYILIGNNENTLEEISKNMLSSGFSTLLIYNTSNNKINKTK